MSKVIRISAEVYERLQAHAQPFVDTPSDVIERILDQYEQRLDDYHAGEAQGEEVSEMNTISATPTETRRRSRSAVRLIRRTRSGALSEASIQKVLLVSLLNHNGRARTANAVSTVRQLLNQLNLLSSADLEISSEQNDWERWETNTRFARKHLVDEGLLKSDSRHGWWELTEKGTQQAIEIKSKLFPE